MDIKKYYPVNSNMHNDSQRVYPNYTEEIEKNSFTGHNYKEEQYSSYDGGIYSEEMESSYVNTYNSEYGGYNPCNDCNLCNPCNTCHKDPCCPKPIYCKGATGPQGPKGEKGDVGATGPAGSSSECDGCYLRRTIIECKPICDGENIAFGDNEFSLSGNRNCIEYDDETREFIINKDGIYNIAWNLTVIPNGCSCMISILFVKTYPKDLYEGGNTVVIKDKKAEIISGSTIVKATSGERYALKGFSDEGFLIYSGSCCSPFTGNISIYRIC